MGGLKAWIGVLLFCYFSVVDALRLEVPAHSTKCISDDIQSQVLTVGDYSVVSAADASHQVTCRVTSPSGKQLHYSENVQVGQFAFTTQEVGNFMVCFWFQHASLGTTINVDLDWKVGVAAKDWADVAKKEKLDVST
jgi:predicted outer membrane lipoprotein